MSQADLLHQHRLERIRRGECLPRFHVPEEVRAYEYGRQTRRSLWAAILTVFTCVVAGQLALTSKNPPAVNFVASSEVSK